MANEVSETSNRRSEDVAAPEEMAQGCRAKRGESPPETFDFLGFTHISGKTRRGDFTVHRKTSRKKFQIKSSMVTDAEDPSSLSKCEVCQSTSKVRAVCGSSARTDLCGGRPAMAVPDAIPAK